MYWLRLFTVLCHLRFVFLAYPRSTRRYGRAGAEGSWFGVITNKLLMFEVWAFQSFIIKSGVPFGWPRLKEKKWWTAGKKKKESCLWAAKKRKYKKKGDWAKLPNLEKRETEKPIGERRKKPANQGRRKEERRERETRGIGRIHFDPPARPGGSPHFFSHFSTHFRRIEPPHFMGNTLGPSLYPFHPKFGEIWCWN